MGGSSGGWPVRAVVFVVVGCFVLNRALGQQPASKTGKLPASSAPKTKVVVPPEGKGDKKPQKTPKKRIGKLEREVVGFVLRGSKRRHRLSIDDLEMVLDSSQRRFIPLLRILKYLGVKIERKDEKISFRFERWPEVVVNPSRGEIQFGDKKEKCDILVLISEITRKEDVYIDVSMLSKILHIDIAWDEMNYEFIGKTKRTLWIWKRRKGKSLLSILAQEIVPDLPIAHKKTALPRDHSLDFAEIRAQIRGMYRALKQERSHEAQIVSPKQQLWGSFYRGAYKFRFSQQSLRYSRQGSGFREGTPIKLDSGQWVRRLDQAELLAGDSSFGLDNINLSSVRMTGMRISGFAGRKNINALEQINYGLRPRFAQPRVFEGLAKAGSKVELFINDKLIDTEEVVADSPTRPGYGSYRFEDIRFSPGIMYEVRIVITDPDGVETVLEKDILGSSRLLPKGETSYMAAVGTKRSTSDCRLDGLIGAGRYLYGLTPRVTLGGSFATYDGIYGGKTNVLGEREYPQSGMNIGGQLSWLMTNSFMFSADLAASQASGEGKYSDYACRIKTDWYPSRRFKLHSQFFNYGPDFFDGQNVRLHDRRGFAVLGNWKVHKKCRIYAVGGRVWNNLDGKQDETLSVNYQRLRVSTTAIAKTSITVEANRLAPSWEKQPYTIYRVKVRTTPLQNLRITADIWEGDTLSMGDHAELVDSLRIPGLVTQRNRQVSLEATKTISSSTSVGAAYRKTPQQTSASVFHSYRSRSLKRFQVRTELGWDWYGTEQEDYPYLENRCEYLLDSTGKNRVGVKTRYRKEQWTVLAYLNLHSLFAFDEVRPYRVTRRRISPDRGTIAGKVFLDYNANGCLDHGEPGVEDVKVRIGRLYNAFTDKKGRFLLPAVRNLRKVRVFVDIDSVPAIYSVVHGMQLVEIEPGRMSHVNLALTPLITITGHILCERPGKKPKPILGIRVELVHAKTNKVICDSYTASDGSYYLGDVKPGKYILRVDKESIPKYFKLAETSRKVTVTPGKDYQELTLPPIIATAVSHR